MKTNAWKQILRNKLPRPVVQILIRFKIMYMTLWWFVLCTIRRIFFLKIMIRKTPKLHIGCGDVHFKNCVNIDFRATRATDIVENCVYLTSIPSRSISTVYANAFLEHVYLKERLTCLRSVRRVLRDDGFAVCTAIPDFQRVAQSYLNKKV